MEISDQELRALVRDAIARQSGVADAASDRVRPDAFDRAHPSHGRLPLAAGSEQGGLCLIEPAVRCNHCGYCQSFGH
jgi:hypothetical protein